MPPSTPDLSTHFEDLAYKFPAEPIERAVIRFCEAIASWRGKPELENVRLSSRNISAIIIKFSSIPVSEKRWGTDYRTDPEITANHDGLADTVSLGYIAAGDFGSTNRQTTDRELFCSPSPSTPISEQKTTFEHNDI